MCEHPFMRKARKSLISSWPELEKSLVKLTNNDHDELLMFADFLSNGNFSKGEKR